MLEQFFSPRSVAVVGVSREEGKVGHYIFDNLLEAGFRGHVYPVNPRAADVHGHVCYPSITDVPGPVDLAIIVVPAAHVASVIEECGQHGTQSVIVISAGFKETGPSGAVLERDVLAAAARHNIRVLGPNCLGLISTSSDLNASFAASMPEQGTIAFMSQSGALGTAVLDWAAGEGIGLSRFVSLGNKADVSEVDLVRTWTEDPDTSVVAAYLEAVSDGRAFVDAATALSAVKPLIALKAGGSDAGARAVSSHTGSLAGSEQAYDAAFRKAGVIRARSVQELFDFSVGFARQPLPSGPGLVILTNAGGPAILATDACERSGVSLSSLEPETIQALQDALPAAAAFYNPVDVLGDATPERYEVAGKILAKDPNVRAILVILTPQAMTQAADIARVVVELSSSSRLPVFASFMGKGAVAEAIPILRDGLVPHFEFPERAVATLSAMLQHRRQLDTPRTKPPVIEADKAAVRQAIDHAVAAGRTFITEQSASLIAESYGITVPAGGLAKDLEAARVLAAEVGYPVVLKIASPDILHKSDIGGIRIGISDEAELDEAYEDIINKVRARMEDANIWGVTVQRMLDPGREVIIGVNRDPQFGPLLMFGLGGIYVEVMKDVTFRLCPVTTEEARTMLSEIRGFGLLRGARGQHAADLDAVIDTIVRISALVTDFPEITELDINPLIVADKGGGAVAADIRIGIGG